MAELLRRLSAVSPALSFLFLPRTARRPDAGNKERREPREPERLRHRLSDTLTGFQNRAKFRRAPRPTHQGVRRRKGDLSRFCLSTWIISSTSTTRWPRRGCPIVVQAVARRTRRLPARQDRSRPRQVMSSSYCCRDRPNRPLLHGWREKFSRRVQPVPTPSKDRSSGSIRDRHQHLHRRWRSWRRDDQNADAAMYYREEMGRNNFQFLHQE